MQFRPPPLRQGGPQKAPRKIDSVIQHQFEFPKPGIRTNNQTKKQYFEIKPSVKSSVNEL